MARRMTRRQYKDLVLFLNKIIDIMELIRQERLEIVFLRIHEERALTIELGHLLNSFLKEVLGSVQRDKFVSSCWKKVCGQNADSSSEVYGIGLEFFQLNLNDFRGNRRIFFSTLAKFCEPLLVKSEEKPKGGGK